MFVTLLSVGVGRPEGQSIWQTGGGLPRSAKAGRVANEGDGYLSGTGASESEATWERVSWGPDSTPATNVDGGAPP